MQESAMELTKKHLRNVEKALVFFFSATVTQAVSLTLIFNRIFAEA